jgi:hypothetical protein
MLPLFEQREESTFKCNRCGGNARMTATTTDKDGRRLPLSERTQEWSCSRCRTSAIVHYEPGLRRLVVTPKEG